MFALGTTVVLSFRVEYWENFSMMKFRIKLGAHRDFQILLAGVISCGRLSAPAYGSVSGYRYTYGDVIRYSCRSDYTLTGGSSTRTCTASGYWSGSKPSCVCKWDMYSHSYLNINGIHVKCVLCIKSVVSLNIPV